MTTRLSVASVGLLLLTLEAASIWAKPTCEQLLDVSEMQPSAEQCDAAFRYWHELKDYYFQVCCHTLRSSTRYGSNDCQQCYQQATDSAINEFSVIEVDLRSVFTSPCIHVAGTNRCLPKPKRPSIIESFLSLFRKTPNSI